MKFTYTCKKVSLNDSVKAYAEKKVGKLEKFFKEEPEASVTFSVEKKNRCVAEIMLRGANGTLFRAVCEDPDGDMRGAIDEATAQIERKIRKNKTRLAKNLRAEAVLPELPEEFEAHEEGTFDIVRTKRFTVKPMSVEEDEPAGPQLLCLPQHRFRRCDLRRLSPQQRRLRHHRDRGRRGVSRSESI